MGTIYCGHIVIAPCRCTRMGQVVQQGCFLVGENVDQFTCLKHGQSVVGQNNSFRIEERRAFKQGIAVKLDCDPL